MSYHPEDDLPPDPISPADFDSAEDYEDFMDRAGIRETEESDRWPE